MKVLLKNRANPWRNGRAIADLKLNKAPGIYLKSGHKLFKEASYENMIVI